MEQEKMLWRLQELVLEEFILRKKEELLPMIKDLKGLQETIKGAEEEAKKIRQQIEEAQIDTAQWEKQISIISKQIISGKEKLYSSKGGSLKELLSLQQSILKMEEEAEKGERLYYDKLKTTEELVDSLDRTKTVIKDLKKRYNQDVQVYKEQLHQVELKLADNMLKQEALQEDLTPETLRLFTEAKKRYPKNPVAMMKGGSCSGCHISVPAILITHVREGKKLNYCDSCGRILIRAIPAANQNIQ